MISSPLSSARVLEIEKLLVDKKLPKDLHEQIMLLVASHRWIEQKLIENDALLKLKKQQVQNLIETW